MPVLQDAFLEHDNARCLAASLPHVRKNELVGDGLVHDELGQRLGMLLGVTFPMRPGERLIEEKDNDGPNGIVGAGE